MRERRPFHEAWLWITALALAAGYLFRISGLLALASVLGLTLGLAWLWNARSMAGVSYRRWMKYRRGFPDERVEAAVEVENNKALPLVWFRTSDRWPRDIGPDDQDLLAPSHRPEEGFLHLILSMRGYSKTRRTFPLRLRQRGIYRIGPVEATAGDPFGVFQSNDPNFAPDDRMVVFPEVRPLSKLGLQPDDPFGDRPTRRRLFEDITRPMGVRQHQPEDGFRLIHWPATAKTGQLQTRLFQPVRGLDLVICLNASTFAHHWEGTEPEMLEALIRTSASLVWEAFHQGYRVGLLSNGSIAHSGQAFRIPPGRSSGHLPHLLESLAGLTPVVTAPFERFLLDQAPRLEYGSILVVITAVTPPELMESLIRLRSRNRRTTLIALGEEAPPAIDRVATYHVPRGEGLRLQ
ncbi:MAG TPA: DUF58 domain-containing protein [Anaerolineales bacterium]